MGLTANGIFGHLAQFAIKGTDLKILGLTERFFPQNDRRVTDRSRRRISGAL
jgi:hypothetical protein